MIDVVFESSLKDDAEIAKALEAATAAGRAYYAHKQSEPVNVSREWDEKSEALCDAFGKAQSAAWNITPQTSDGWLALAVSMLCDCDPFGRWDRIEKSLDMAVERKNAEPFHLKRKTQAAE